MAGFSTATTENLTRTSVWSKQLKDLLLDELFATRYVDWITDFPDGTTLNLPSIGQLQPRDYAEGQAILYDSMDTGNWQFTVNKYKSVATYIYDKFKHDSYYTQELMSRIVPNMHRAFAKSMEVDFLATIPNGQTAGNANAINGAAHRWIGHGASETISVVDFELARIALTMANVPLQNLVAIVDPSVEYALASLTNIVNVSNNPTWGGIVREGMSTGTRFKMSVFGWDIYISQNLKKNTATENIGSFTTAVGAANNLFFAATPGLMPVKGLVRQAPKVEFERNKDLQRDEWVATCYYDFKTFWPDNAVVIVTDVDQVTYTS